MSLQIEIRDSLAAIPAEDWDVLVGDDCPFFEHAFLWSLEEAACVGPNTGWLPRYVLVRRGRRLVGALPLYRKDDSYGEFIFDWAWADAAHRAGLPYYPKLVVAAPFSPVGGRRFLLAPGEDDTVREALLAGSRAAAENEPATGVHWLFVAEDEARFLAANGLAIRHTRQFQWRNAGYADFDAFLQRFRSKRRAQIRRERRHIVEAGIQTRVVRGDALGPRDLRDAWQFYRTTVDKYFWGRRYLNRRLFELLFERWSDRICLVKAERDGKVLGGAVNVQKGDVLYGRYWGCRQDERFLHFEVCSYAGIEHAIASGIQRFEAGAGGGGHKFGRGFLPTITRSAHEIFIPPLDDAIRRFLAAEREELGEALERAEGRVLKPIDQPPVLTRLGAYRHTKFAVRVKISRSTAAKSLSFGYVACRWGA